MYASPSRWFSRGVLEIAVLAGYVTLGLVPPANAVASEPTPTQRIQQFEAGLLPAVLIKGKTPTLTKLGDLMAKRHVPGVSIAVIHHGKVEWARGYGVTRIGGPPVTPNTLFQAASISKSVTATGVLRLVQNGTLDLDANVNKYLKSWKVPANKFTDRAQVTLRELLSHTAGMTVHGFPGYASDATVPSLVQVLNGQAPANTPPIRVDTVPGTKWRYSGGGYDVVEQAVEDVTGKPFASVLQTLVLKPVGMTRSTFEQPLPASRLGEVAMPYKANGKPITGGPHVYPSQAPAGLWTTPTDLASFAIALQQAYAGKTGGVISPATAKLMQTAVMNHYGLGLAIGDDPKHPRFEHSGANAGYRSVLVALDDGDGVIAMTNSDNGGSLLSPIVRTIAYEYDWPADQPSVRTIARVSAAQLDRLTGSYKLSPDFILTVTRDGDHLVGRDLGNAELKLLPESDTKFFSTKVDAEITFETKGTGPASALVMHEQGGPLMKGVRLDDQAAAAVAKQLAAIERRYKTQTAAPGSEAALRGLMKGLRSGNPDYARMSPNFAQGTRQQLPNLQALLKRVGKVVTMSFTGVDVNGWDRYDVTYEHGVIHWKVIVDDAGKIESANLQLD